MLPHLVCPQQILSHGNILLFGELFFKLFYLLLAWSFVVLFAWSLHRKAKRNEHAPDMLFHVGSLVFFSNAISHFFCRPQSRRIVGWTAFEYSDKAFSLFERKCR